MLEDVYLGQPETDNARGCAMTVLGNALSAAEHHEDALSVRETQLAMVRRLGDSVENILIAQGNLVDTYACLGRLDEAHDVRRQVYFGWIKLHGEEHYDTLREANNYAFSLLRLQRFEEVKSLIRKTMPVARRVLGEGHGLTLKMRSRYAAALFKGPSATLDDVRKAVTTLEETEQTARRVLGGAHPLTMDIEGELQDARAALYARGVALSTH